MKLLISGLLSSVVLMASGSALADRYQRHYDHHYPSRTTIVYERPAVYARVVSAEPIYREVAVDAPYENCGVERTNYRSASRHDVATGAIVGGLIGAVIGHEIGGRHDAFFGGVSGAQIGQNIAYAGGRTRYEDREVCRTSYHTEYRRQLVGYDVGYSYNGRVYYTEAPRHPGTSIRVNIRLD